MADLFSEVPLQEMLLSVQREIRQRHQVYTRLVNTGRMKIDFAARQIAVMEAIYATLKNLDDGKCPLSVSGGFCIGTDARSS